MRSNLFDYGFLFGLLFFFAFVPMTKLVLGALLTILGAFFPASITDRLFARGSKASFSILGSSFSVNGSLRLVVIIAGIFVIATSTGDVREAYSTRLSGKEKEEAWNSVCADILDRLPQLRLDESVGCEPWKKRLASEPQ